MLGQIISEVLTDPRIAFATVTSVEVTPDLRTAKSADVALLGGNARVQFYALRFGRHYGTLAVNYFPGESDPTRAAVPIYAR